MCGWVTRHNWVSFISLSNHCRVRPLMHLSRHSTENSIRNLSSLSRPWRRILLGHYATDNYQFIFIAPLVAKMSIDELRKNSVLIWGDIFLVSVEKSTKANFWVAVIYNSIVFLMVVATAISMGDGGDGLTVMIQALFFLALIQFIL